MGIPQMIILVVYMISLGIVMAKHGKTEIKEYNFWLKLIGTVLGIGILAWGGFFD